MKYFTSDLHLHHPFVAALRGYAKPEYAHLAAADLREYARTNRWKPVSYTHLTLPTIGG